MSKQKPSKLTVEDHLKNAPEFIKKLFRTLENEISKLDKAKENVRGNYIGYKFTPDNEEPRLFVEVHIQTKKEQIALHLRPIEYNDPNNKIFPYNYIPKWPLRSGIIVTNQEELNYALPFIKESYKAIL